MRIRRFHLALLAVAATLVASGGAEAQSRRRAPQPSGAQGYSAQPAYPNPRGADIYSRPPGGQGTIRWNTPHSDGNLGSQSTGGGGGGGA